MGARERNDAIFSHLLGRKLISFEVDYKKEELLLLFEGGHCLRMFKDDEAIICLDLGREERH